MPVIVAVGGPLTGVTGTSGPAWNDWLLHQAGVAIASADANTQGWIVSPSTVTAPGNIDVTPFPHNAAATAAAISPAGSPGIWQYFNIADLTLYVEKSDVAVGNGTRYYSGGYTSMAALTAPTVTSLGNHQYSFSLPSAPAGTDTYSWLVDGTTTTASGAYIGTFAPGIAHYVVLLAEDNEGRWSFVACRWTEANIGPTADFTYSFDGTHVEVNGALSDDPDDYPTTPLAYSWNWGDGSDPDTTSGVNATHDYDLGGEPPEEFTFTVCLTVSDGALTDTECKVLEIQTIGRISAAIRHNGMMIMAVEASSSVQFYRAPDGIGTRVLTSVISDHGRPSLWRQGAFFYCGVRAYDDGDYVVFRSADDAREWVDMGSAAWDGGTYDTTRARTCGLIGGGAASIAPVDGSSPEEWRIKISPDGATWGSAFQAFTYSGTATNFDVLQRADSGRNDIIITNNVDKQVKSNGIPKVTADFSDY